MENGAREETVVADKVRRALARLSAEIQQARKAKGFTQQQTAELAGLSVVTVSKVEIQQNVPSLETLLALAYALDQSPNGLLGWVEPASPLTEKEEALARLISVARGLDSGWIRALSDLATKAVDK